MNDAAPDDSKTLMQRVEKLAADKSHLQLVLRMINRISAASGLEDTVQSVLRNVLDVIGGQNIAIYYRIDQDLFFADVYGKKEKLDRIDDALVNAVFETRLPTEFVHDFRDTGMLAPEFTKAYTWAFPLFVGKDLFGVLKMESLHVDLHEWDQQFPAFLNYASLL